jgi:three-Cys-motif partner protein
LAYLRKYAEAFMIAMAPKRADGKWEQLVYIDPLCGPGLDVDRRSGEEFPGSPLIALNTGPAFDRLYFGDLDVENVATLQARIAGSALPRVSLEAKDCHARAEEVVQTLSRRALGLAFIDPEGFEVHWPLFEILGQRAIDIVFLFPSGIGIVRNLARYVQEPHSDLDKLWGNREWRQLPMAQMAAGRSPDVDPGDAYYQSWAAAFCDRVATLGYSYHDIKGPLRTEKKAPMYHLLFLSKNQAGLTIWRNVHRISPGGQRNFLFEG